MKDRVSPDIGTEKSSLDWAGINWQLVNQRIRNLRARIYRATQNGQWNRVRSLMKLMLRSYSNLLWSVRRITQENQGRHTAGLDGQTALTPQKRVQLVQRMQAKSLWQVHPTKRVYIPKANGKLRPLGIPTIENRVAQTIVKNALEPSWEARFESHSYGFRPGRSCQDAIEQCHTRLRQGGDTWILDADLKGAFDHLSHQFILNTIGPVPGRELIKQWLKAGYVEAEMFQATEEGTPQGGTISPLLLNIALNGIEQLLSSITLSHHQSPADAKRSRPPKKTSPTYGYCRYADDFLITAKTKVDIEALIPALQDWLQVRGLELNWDKTQVVSVQEGCHFLGFTIRHFKQRCLCRPQKEKVKALLLRIRNWLRSHPTVTPEAVIHFLNPILRGWANYYKHGASKAVFSYVDSQIWKAIWRWCRRRHPNKGSRWIARKYYRTLKGRDWTFVAPTLDRAGNQTLLTITRLAAIPIQRYVKVKGTASPDDPTLRDYWYRRQTQLGKTYWEKGSKYYRVAQCQQWQCPICHDPLLNGEPLHTHHRIPLKDGGTDLEENLIHLHKACHQQVHSRREFDVADGLSRLMG